ncbi:MAG: STAS-like domain-containing protein [Planctomycetota bacterium]|nr:STAS-like domain-containing protein [Planctomycetota bacterium]
MASGNALLGLRGDVPEVWERDPSDAERVYRKIVGWPGTVVVLDFPVDGIPDFSEILKRCGSLADEARRMSGPAGLDFLSSTADIEKAFTLLGFDFEEDTEAAVRIRETVIRPKIENGETVIIDFHGIRSPTQSFVHALLSEIFKIPDSLVRLSFLNCTASAREVIKAVAAYASYRQIV